MSASSAETFARAATSGNKSAEEKLMLIARSLAELAQAVGQIQIGSQQLKR